MKMEGWQEGRSYIGKPGKIANGVKEGKSGELRGMTVSSHEEVRRSLARTEKGG